MNAEERRQNLLQRLSSETSPCSASLLAREFGVSRQVIVQDVALLRAQGAPIVSLARGYCLERAACPERIFKVCHSDAEVEEELNLIVDLGGAVCDVFVFHKYYGTVRAEMKIRNRMEVKAFLQDIATGKSSLLKNVTGGYHYHTVTADREQTLDLIEGALSERGFLAPLKEHEPSGVARGPAQK